MEVIFETLVIVTVLGLITVLANLVDIRKNLDLQKLLILAILSINFLVFSFGLLSLFDVDEDGSIELAKEKIAYRIIGAFLMVLVSGFSSFLLLPRLRIWIAQFFPPYTAGTKPLFPFMNTLNNGEIEFGGKLTINNRPNYLLGFQPRSWVHTWALILVILGIGVQISSYFREGGLSGVAEDIKVDYLLLISNMLLYVTIPVIGVGIFVRRSPRETMERLGLGRLSITGVGVSIGLTFGLLMLVIFFNLLWMGLVSEETYKEQTEAVEALSKSINSLGLAFTLAATAAIGEEIAFRGALQPIFGFWATALIFAINHVQYTLTPAFLLIFLVAIALGWVRQQFNTTTAILVHFLYNFTPFLLGLIFEEETTSGFIRLLF